GEQSAVVWKRLYLSPFAASRSAVGVEHGPPKALDAAKPTSSSSTISTFGAPAGGRSGSIGANVAVGSFASRIVGPGSSRSGIGRIVRARASVIRGSSEVGWRPGGAPDKAGAPSGFDMSAIELVPALGGMGAGTRRPKGAAAPRFGPAGCVGVGRRSRT